MRGLMETNDSLRITISDSLQMWLTYTGNEASSRQLYVFGDLKNESSIFSFRFLFSADADYS